ncbi:DegT/DnrJ/EryC1/StrS family aminotransferase [Glacieibacterium megasporae]|uniref:DegT/DnrJ/EryC1/StrS family aminotransferase n=1 Tax=Glacieibacterium megasporae TaxID=2835787 RepID=UPI001C1E0ADE|nr:DegT/DnrJ/EryC1/StrS family aminotransferase [Polymorphobacter megasporae]UAJ08754.1 DegT/DnrJ/EryC1/StrS family aminotransferase [Polymorphobacter megasporae]
MDIPLIRPNPPKLSTMVDRVREIEDSGIYSNSGPVVQRFEQAITQQLFGGRGACLAVNNATLGLMIAIKSQTYRMDPARRLALLPAFTFAATGHAAHWAGLTPLLVDCDEDDWTLCEKAEQRLLSEHRGRIAAIVPYATFGTSIDLERYAWIARRHDIAVVIDAAASLGTLDESGRGFGTDCQFPVVFSMHATKTFATSEGGLIYCATPAKIETMRAMSNFGFESGRSATLPGINAKLAEIPALLAEAKLAEIEDIAAHRYALAQRYRRQLSNFAFQRARGHRQAPQFMPLLSPASLAKHRAAIIASLSEAGIGAGTYFSPHLGEQPWFREIAVIDPLPVTADISTRILSLPITDSMTEADVDRVAETLVAICARLPRSIPATALPRDRVLGTVIIGGGPAGTAILCAAARSGKLEQMAADGIAVIDRSVAIGSGMLGHYAITSDSTAETFLSANAALPKGAGREIGDASRALEDHKGALGVPLTKVGAYLEKFGDILTRRMVSLGGEVLRGHEVISAQRTCDGLWSVRARCIADGKSIVLTAMNLVLATGGHQPARVIAEEKVAGRTLVERCGDRLIQSDTILSVGGLERVAELLPKNRPARIVIVGGSTSAATSAALMLRDRADKHFQVERVTVMSRRPFRLFYPSADAARADGYSDFDEDDICPLSGFVYRLAGLRLEARELIIHALGIGGRSGDPRLRLHRLAGASDPTAEAALDTADLVIAAFGYRPNALPLFDENGRDIRLRSDGLAAGSMVDDSCRVVDSAEMPLDGVYGVGLASGFVPAGRFGGERSFQGQANGLWTWQNPVGEMIVDQLTASRVDEVPGLRITA